MVDHSIEKPDPNPRDMACMAIAQKLTNPNHLVMSWLSGMLASSSLSSLGFHAGGRISTLAALEPLRPFSS